MSQQTILVTGAAGFVGGHVLTALRGREGRVLGLVRREAQAEKVTALGAEPVFGDVTEPESLTKALAGVDRVIHLAAVNRNRGGVTMELVNYRGTVNLLGAARAAGVQHLVQVIGIGADSRRTAPLLRTQGLAAEAVLGAGLPATIIESAVIYGRGDVFVSTLAGLARVSPVVIVPGDGQARFEPIAAQEVGEAAANALDKPLTIGQRYQIAGPEVLSFDAVYDTILETLAVRRLKLRLPVGLLRPLVRLMDRLLPEPPVAASLLDLIEQDLLVGENAAGMLLGRRPRRFGDHIGFVDEMTAGGLLAIMFGRRDRRGGADLGQ